MERKNNLLTTFFLIAIAVSIGYVILMDPFSGLMIAGGIIVLMLAVLAPWILVSMLLAFTPFQILWFNSSGIAFLEVVYSGIFVLLLTCWMIMSISDLAIKDELPKLGSATLFPLALFFVVTLYSVFIAISKDRPLLAWGSHLNLISFYAICFVIAGYLRSLKDLNRIFIVLFIFTLIAVVRGVFYNLAVDPKTVYIGGSAIPRIARASSAGLVIFMMSIPFAVLSKDNKVKIFYVLSTLFFGIQQVVAFVRSRWLGSIAGIIFLFLVLTPMRKMRFLKYILIVLLLVCIYIEASSFFPYENLLFRLPYLISERFSTILRPSEEPTAVTRFSEWKAAIEKIRQHPIMGNGLGTQVSYIRYDRAKMPIDTSVYIHNSYLFYYLNTGLFGLIAILWFSVAFIFYGLKVCKATKNEYYSIFALSCVVAFVALSAASFTGPELSFPGRTIVIGFLVGAVALIDKHKT